MALWDLRAESSSAFPILRKSPLDGLFFMFPIAARAARFLLMLKSISTDFLPAMGRFGSIERSVSLMMVLESFETVGFGRLGGFS